MKYWKRIFLIINIVIPNEMSAITLKTVIPLLLATFENIVYLSENSCH